MFERLKESLRRPASAQLAPVFAGLIACVAALYVWHARTNAVEEVAARAHANAAIAASYASEVFGTVELALRAADSTPATPAIVVREDPDSLRPLLARVKRSTPALDAIAYIDASGRVIASSAGIASASVDLSDRPYFRHLRENEDFALRINRPISARPSGRTYIPVAMRAEDAQGRFAGIIAGFIDPAYCARLFANLGPDSIVSIVDEDGYLYARNPIIELVGAKARAFPPLHDGRSFHILQPSDGSERRLVVSQQIGWSGLYVVVSVPEHEILATWAARSAGAVLVAALGVVLAFLAGEIFRRRAREAAAELAASSEDAARFRTVARNKSDFLAHMGHEIRTPINAIVGFSEVIATDAMKLGVPARYREYAADIRFSADHLLAIINSILDMSKIEAGKWKLSLGPVDPRHALSTARHLADQRAAKEGVRIETDDPAAVLPLVADERVVVQILLNLTINAIKFAGEDRLVRLGCRALPDDRIEFWVADRGRGMTPEQARRVLEPFETAGDGDRRSETGLGLPLSLMFARLHGGTIEIDTAPGKGTRVRLLLPMRGPQAAANAA